MKKYTVQFYFETDMRASHVVSAKDETSALIKALELIGEETWCDSRSFSIKISRA